MLAGDAYPLAAAAERAVAAGSISLGRAAHAAAIKIFSPSLPSFLSTHFINLYSKLGRPAAAAAALAADTSPSVASFTAFISGASQNGRPSTALSAFAEMMRCGLRPNDFTFPSAFKAAGAVLDGVAGMGIHSLALRSGFLPADVFVGTAAVDMYCKMRRAGDARKVFDEMGHRNVVAWNAVMTNAVLDGRNGEAMEAFLELRASGQQADVVSFVAAFNACAGVLSQELGEQVHAIVVKCKYAADVRVGNALIDFYGKCQRPACARRMFDWMALRNDVSWCSLVAVYAQNDAHEDALAVYVSARRDGVLPTSYMVSSMLTTCSGVSHSDLGKSLHAVATRSSIDSNIYVASALVDMYGKCGGIADAEQVFEETTNQNLVSWNAMIGSYSHYGDACSALALFEKMVHSGEVAPNAVTFVSLITACSRAGLTEQGFELFESMRERFGIEPQTVHYACVVDLLGRDGKEEQAYKIIQEMPMQPTAAVWGALLAACKMHGKAELGKIAADKLFELEPQDSGNHVLLYNTFARVGRWVEAEEVRMEMKHTGMTKGPGFSWIAWQNTINVFHAKDTSHPMHSEIQMVLAKLKEQMLAIGYVPDTQHALYDLELEERETEVLQHSEKLALAFGLLCIPPPLPIRITKNLRICDDCHRAFVLISGIVQRDIIVRDNNRFHHFKNHKCSCKDYW